MGTRMYYPMLTALGRRFGATRFPEDAIADFDFVMTLSMMYEKTWTSVSFNLDLGAEEDVEDSDVSKEESKEKEIISEKKCIVYESKLLQLLQGRHGKHCVRCNTPFTYRSVSRGTAIIVIWECEKGHKDSWTSQPRYNGMFAGNLHTAASILLSGNSFQKIAAMCHFLEFRMMTSSTFNRIQKLHMALAVQEFYSTLKDELLASYKEPVVLSGDGRSDSPGHSATFCTYSFCDEKTKKILHTNSVMVQEASGKSPNMERIAFERGLDFVAKKVKVATVVTDAHSQIRAMMKHTVKYEGIRHQWDVWHGSKNLIKKMSLGGHQKGCRDLLPWVPHIRNHFWFSGQTFGGDAEKLTGNLSWHPTSHALMTTSGGQMVQASTTLNPTSPKSSARITNAIATSSRHFWYFLFEYEVLKSQSVQLQHENLKLKEENNSIRERPSPQEQLLQQRRQKYQKTQTQEERSKRKSLEKEPDKITVKKQKLEQSFFSVQRSPKRMNELKSRGTRGRRPLQKLVNDQAEWIKELLQYNSKLKEHQSDSVTMMDGEAGSMSSQSDGKKCVYSLLDHNVSFENVGCVNETVLWMIRKSPDHTPTGRTVANMNRERLLLAQKQLEELVKHDNLTIGTDENPKAGDIFMAYTMHDKEGSSSLSVIRICWNLDYIVCFVTLFSIWYRV